MAALTYRQVADIYTRQAAAFDRLAKVLRVAARDLPQGPTATEAELRAAIAMYDQSMRAYYTADSAASHAAEFNQRADDAGEPA